MSAPTTRRDFLQSTVAGGTLFGLGDLSFLDQLPLVSAAETRLSPDVVRFDPEIEPLVRLLEDTPRDRLLEEVAGRISRGLTYREVLAALLLAGVRNVQPRPSVGFKFHAVLVVNSAHIASISSPDSDRWLPIFWALDYFKSAQAQDVRENNWTMDAVDESAVPTPRRARKAFVDAMNNWDESAADAAVAGLARSAGAAELLEIFCRYGARDFRSIGHKAIFVANSWRTLQCIGWRYAEPVLRSLSYALLNHEGGNPAQRDAQPDRPWRRNTTLVGRIPETWRGGKLSSSATQDMLQTLRSGNEEESCDKVVEILNQGVGPQSIWDALLCGAGELLMRRPGIVSLHAVTTTNALRFAFDTSGNDETRRLMLLQNAAFLPMFRDSAAARGGSSSQVRVDRFEAKPLESKGPEAVSEIFAHVSRDNLKAAGKTLAYLEQTPEPRAIIDAARRLVFLKGSDSHDYKFSSAALEDYYHVSPHWRDRFLASSMFNLRGSSERDNRLVARTRAALNA